MKGVLLLTAVLALAVSGSALAAADLPPPEIEAQFESGFTPKALSKSKPAPLSSRVAMDFKTSDGSHPPALQAFTIEVDRHAQLNLKDVPSCPPGTVESPPIQQRCKDAAIGSGRMSVDIQFPEEVPSETQSRLTVYNGGVRKGIRTLLIATYVEIPTPAQFVSTVLVSRSAPGRYKLKLVGSIPKIAGGSGSVTYFGLRLRKGILSATCVDRHLDTRFSGTFVDGTVRSGTVSRPCVPSP